MQLEFSNRQIELVCSSHREAVRKYGDGIAKSLIRIVSQLSAATSREELDFSGFHPLKGDRSGQHAYGLSKRMRLVVQIHRILNDSTPSELTKIEIMEIVDYHNE